MVLNCYQSVQAIFKRKRMNQEQIWSISMQTFLSYIWNLPPNVVISLPASHCSLLPTTSRSPLCYSSPTSVSWGHWPWPTCDLAFYLKRHFVHHSSEAVEHPLTHHTACTQSVCICKLYANWSWEEVIDFIFSSSGGKESTKWFLEKSHQKPGHVWIDCGTDGIGNQCRAWRCRTKNRWCQVGFGCLSGNVPLLWEFVECSGW